MRLSILISTSYVLGSAVARHPARQVNENLTESTSAVFSRPSSYPTEIIVEIQIGDLKIAETIDLAKTENATSFTNSSSKTLETSYIVGSTPTATGPNTATATTSLTSPNTATSISITGSSIATSRTRTTGSSTATSSTRISGPNTARSSTSITDPNTATSSTTGIDTSSETTSIRTPNITYSFMTLPKAQSTSFAIPILANTSLTGGATPSQLDTTLFSAILCTILGVSC